MYNSSRAFITVIIVNLNHSQRLQTFDCIFLDFSIPAVVNQICVQCWTFTSKEITETWLALEPAIVFVLDIEAGK